MTLESSEHGVVELGNVHATPAGEFQASFSIPEVSASPYQLAAAAGEEKAFVDFTVSDGSTQDQSTGEQSAGGHTGASPSGSGDTLVFQRSNVETLAIGLIITALIIGGVVLILAGTRGQG